MKIEPRRVEPFLAAPDAAVRACLVYGPDRGLVGERAARLARAIVPDPKDAFRVAALSAESLLSNPARLHDEAAQLSLMGGRRLVHVSDAGDAVGALFARYLADPPAGDGFVLVEGGDLKPRSSLRRAFEGAKNAAAIACYPDGPREIEALVREVARAHRIAIAPDALPYLVSSLGGDRGLSRQELEKLALFAGDGGTVTLADAAALVGDSADLSLEDAVLAAAEGKPAACERALARALAEGEAPIRILRAAQRHFTQLHRTAARVDDGAGADEAIAAIRPPLFFKLKDSFKRQLRLWPARRAAAVLVALVEAERQAKSSGMPGETICRAALLRIARGAMQSSRHAS
ncbi:MAG: DNA polymerase III subunit delta [Alphaproteobacteria bacterium]|nr:DNA polymerase III subunit delta [Alphaproteobacteria bacterium]